LPDAEAEPDVLQHEEQRVSEYFLPVFGRFEDRGAEGKGESLELQPVDVSIEHLDCGLIEAPSPGVEIGEIDSKTRIGIVIAHGVSVN
jgi:hypothetical protein